MTSTTVVTTCTRDCPNTCGLIATVTNGRLTGLRGDPDHPLTRGAACGKTSRYIERVYSPERITRPMIRKNGAWRQVSWDEALDLVAETMLRIRAESGPEAILHYQGYGERTALKLLNRYFFNLFGGVTTMTGSLCGGAGQGAQNLDFGRRISHDPLDHLNSRSMVLWARNPASTNISLVPMVHKVRKRGGRVLVVDPVATRSVSLADRHIRPRPGGDGYLAMAAAKRILAAGAEDRDFLKNHSQGFAAYRAILDRYDENQLCRLAGVSGDDVRALAETCMAEGPTAILLGWGLHRHEHAHHMIRPIDALSAISGNIGVPGGGVSQGFEEYGPYDPQYWGDHLNPPRRTLLIPRVGEEILKATDPEIRMICVTAGNPLCMAPNSARVAEAFGKAELVVYSGHFLDDTAQLADVFLPATTFLEEDDVVASYGHNYVGPVNRAIEPVGQTMSEFHMFCELARRFDFAQRYRRSADDWLRDICAPVWQQGGSLRALKQGALRLDAPMVPYADRVFPTPSGRFQFMTELDPPTMDANRAERERAERDSADRDSAEWGRADRERGELEFAERDRAESEFAESERGEFEPADVAGPVPCQTGEYPYALLTIAPHHTICSERTVAEHAALPVVRLNAGEARARGLRSGATVLVRSCVGAVRARLDTDPALRRDVLVAERGGWARAGHGLNRLTRDMASRVGDGTPFYETRVTVQPDPDPGPVVLVVHGADHAPGDTFRKELERAGAAWDSVRPWQGEPLPQSPEGYDALVVLGDPLRAADHEASPVLQCLMDLMGGFDAAGRSVLGLGPGCLLLARAHGARIRRGEVPEFGFVRSELTRGGRADPLLARVSRLPRVMVFHEETFDLPRGAELLVRGADRVPQGFRVGNCSYGFLFHPEVDSRMADDWLRLMRRGTEKHWSKDSWPKKHCPEDSCSKDPCAHERGPKEHGPQEREPNCPGPNEGGPNEGGPNERELKGHGPDECSTKERLDRFRGLLSHKDLTDCRDRLPLLVAESESLCRDLVAGWLALIRG